MIGVDCKIRVPNERQCYTVRAFDDRYVIMTKPFNARKTYLYSIIDRVRGVRGPDNLIFGPMLSYVDQPRECLGLLQSGEMEVSYRRCIPIEPEVAAQLETIWAWS